MFRILKCLLLLLLCYHEINAGKKVCSKLPNTAEESTLSALRKKILCKYDAETPPINATNPRVNVTLFMNGHRMEHSGNSESLHSYLSLWWKDERLKWEKGEYKNHTYVNMKPSEIWTPSLIPAQGWGYFGIPRYVLVASSGQVDLLLWWEAAGRCKPAYAKWTDKRTCTLSFLLEPAEKLFLAEPLISEYQLTVNEDLRSSWTITDIREEVSNGLKKSSNDTESTPGKSKLITSPGLITLEFDLQRNTAVMDATLFSPAADGVVHRLRNAISAGEPCLSIFEQFLFLLRDEAPLLCSLAKLGEIFLKGELSENHLVLFLLILASTWIPSGRSIRLAVLSLTILLGIFLMHFATKAIPTLPGSFTDFAVLYRDIVLVSGAAFFEWYVSYLVACKKIASSGYLQSFAGTASQSSYAFLRSLLLIPSNPPKVENGTLEGAFLSVILDRITFIVLLIVFIITTILSDHVPTKIKSE